MSHEMGPLSIEERSTMLVEKFMGLSNWEDRYAELIKMGRLLPDMPAELKVEEKIVKGCQSQVWLHVTRGADGSLEFIGDSDALIVKGLVAVLIFIYSGAQPQDILKTPPEFLKHMGFEGNLSPSRANGLHAMLKQIKLYAMAFTMMDTKTK
jgi:cysteine desulfuration protein SufE